VRCYSLSHAPRSDRYQVTIKRVEGGRVSTHVAEALAAGDSLELRPPAGTFTLEGTGEGPLVFVAGGVGITPCMSMLEALAAGARRETFLFYGVRNAREHAFAARIAALAGDCLKVFTAYSRPESGDRADALGRLDLALLQEHLPPRDEPYQFFLCGPGPMLEGFSAGLNQLGVPAAHVHVEAFGALAVKPFTRRLKRRLTELDPAAPPRVRFARSEVEATWDPEAASLLDFAMSQGVFFPFACAAGHCGTCASMLLQGEVDYAIPPQFPLRREGLCLPCIAVPKGDLTLDV
jgi:ferredoxin-NADP reductase